MTQYAIRDAQWAEPTALGFNRGDVTALAVNVAKKLNYQAGEALEPVVKRLGGLIEYGDSEHSDSGSIEITPNGFTIFLSLTTSLLRDRFTIAHELGHFVLHYLYQKQHRDLPITHLRAARYGSGDAENEANWFAAAFLMPPEVFKAKHVEFRGNHSLLSHYFQVSQPASEVRARSLSL